MNHSGKSDNLSKVHHFKIPKRTEGDGMEKEELNKLDHSFLKEETVPLRDQLIYRPVNLRECSVPPTPVTGKIINLVPKLAVSSKKSSSSNVKFSKEPKFVPYEPYKAATNPIVENKTVKNKVVKLVNDTKSNVEDLMKLKKVHISEIALPQSSTSKDSEKSDERIAWEEEKKAMLEELSRLRADNMDLENQIKFQAQVNGEVKKLLVAAVGEDIELRVQSLTEDKLHLAKKLLTTAKTLSTHQEQIEWLAGQGEVWRSKFLASSMLVEDLARWKAGLCQKVADYQNALKLLMNDRDTIRQDVFNTFVNLSTLQEKFNLDVMPQESNQRQFVTSNIVELCASSRSLSDILMTQLLHEDVSQKKKQYELDPVECLTAAEKNAEQVLMQPMISPEHNDRACTAVMTGAALALSSSAPHCNHCNGVVTTV